ncbi:glycosyltransferase family 2 protein [Vibrio cholerae]|uniref:glycosyltransferase family 2 protein n=1 Tax=Vibrio cholerae TaxID=666 RepID=UPI0011D7499A|nr:glycosyltransferase family A protein [Vibrio cholerae]TXY76715.1 glycosyltransferase family 2 protein [Vibrio cholerae]BCN21902.1 putative glycosyltransferase [Vibrio cholerae]GIB17871.1 putative glycosyl transferase [Vibrio cholerae]
MNSDKKLLSLIIPVYNSEKYLKECLNSVFNQYDSNLEIIIVNDGSTDNSKDIIENYQDAGHEFIYIEKKNGGLSSARNAGIMLASGEYIAFLDSDDLWCVDIYSRIKSLFKLYPSDCYAFNYIKLKIDGYQEDVQVFWGKSNEFEQTLESKKNELANVSHWFVWRYVFKASYFKLNEFDVGRRFEDQLLIPKLINIVQSVVFSDSYVIQYRQNEKSITNNLKLSDLDDSEYCIIRYLVEYDKNPSKYWSIVLANLYLSHLSKCARLYHQNTETAIDSYKRVNKNMPLKIIIESGNKKALFYYCSLGLLFRRLIKIVKSESI